MKANRKILYNEIEVLRKTLNSMIDDDNLTSSDILKVSSRIDELINEFYLLGV